LENDAWTTILTGASIGANLKKSFHPITVQRVRILITKACANPGISEFQLFPEKGQPTSN